MKEKKLYVCEFCNTSYNNKKDAEECEKNHKKAVKISNMRYLPSKSDRTGRPDRVCIKFEDGSEEWYKR